MEIISASRAAVDGELPLTELPKIALDTDRSELPKEIGNVVLDMRYAADPQRLRWLAFDLLAFAKGHDETKVLALSENEAAQDLETRIWNLDTEIEALQEDIGKYEQKRDEAISRWEAITGKRWLG